MYITDKTFKGEVFTEEFLLSGEYEHCTFINCDFTQAPIRYTDFHGCTFSDCDLSNVQIAQIGFQDVRFSGCKLLGLQFETARPFGFSVSFDHCLLDHATFFQMKLKKTQFRNSRLHHVDFTQADLSGSLFDNCDLAGARFDRSVLDKADLRTAYNYSIDPELNRMKKAKFSLAGVAGLLDKYDIDIT